MIVKDRVGNLAGSLHVLRALVRRDFRLRFTGSALGFAWAVLQPLLMVLCYWFVFTKIFTRGDTSDPDYVPFLISGLLAWMGFADGITRGMTAIVENGAMIRKLTFRSDVLVIVPNVTALIFECIGFGLFIIYMAFRGGDLSGLWLLPFALLLQAQLQIGLGWILSVLNVLFRDVSQVIGFALTLGLFLSPIFYEVPSEYENWFRWNPMTPLLGLFRSALTGAPLPDALSIVFLLVVSAGLFFAGLKFFRRAQPTLADLL